MRIGLNLLHAIPEIGGAWNYIANVVGALAAYDYSTEYLVYTNPASLSLVPDRPNFRKVAIDIPASSRPVRVLYENTLLQYKSKTHRLDCMHWFANTQALCNSAPGVVTVYDLLPFTYRTADFSGVKRRYLRFMMRRTARNAAMLLPISQATADDLTRILGTERRRMRVIHVPVDPRLHPRSADAQEDFKAKYGLPDRYWLYVAHLYAHKNHVGLLHAYAILRQLGSGTWPLVLRGDAKGAAADVASAIESLGLEKDVIMLPRMDVDQLAVLYSASSALVFPSLFEGSGIPVLEAMACGCPVVASRTPAVAESGGDAVEYFDAQDPRAIASAMRRFQDDELLRASCREAGLQRATLFHPREIATTLTRAYREAVQ